MRKAGVSLLILAALSAAGTEAYAVPSTDTGTVSALPSVDAQTEHARSSTAAASRPSSGEQPWLHLPTNLDARLAFLDKHLEAPKLHAQIWWWGWLSFYSLGFVVQSVRLGLVDSAADDAPGQRADLVVSLIKGAGGILNLIFRRLNAQKGAAPMRKIKGDAPEDKLARLRVGEETLKENAKEAHKRLSWLRYVLLVAVNVAGGLIIWRGFDDLTRGITSAAVGIGVGQVVFFSQPWQAIGHLETYEQRFTNNLP